MDSRPWQSIRFWLDCIFLVRVGVFVACLEFPAFSTGWSISLRSTPLRRSLFLPKPQFPKQYPLKIRRGVAEISIVFDEPPLTRASCFLAITNVHLPWKCSTLVPQQSLVWKPASCKTFWSSRKTPLGCRNPLADTRSNQSFTRRSASHGTIRVFVGLFRSPFSFLCCSC